MTIHYEALRELVTQCNRINPSNDYFRDKISMFHLCVIKRAL